MTFFRRFRRPARRAFASEEGYTLAEVAIALVLTSIVLAMGYGTYGFAQSLVLRWQHSIRVENTAHQIVRDVAQQIRAADRITVEGQEWTITTSQARTVTYRMTETGVTRNGTPMHEPSVQVRGLRLKTVPFDPDSPLPPKAARTDGCVPSLATVEPPLAPPSEDASALDVGRLTLYRIHVRAVTSLDSLRVCTTVAARQPETWSTSGP